MKAQQGHSASRPASTMSRRSSLKLLSGAALGAAAATPLAAKESGVYKVKNGRINQSVVSWCFRPMTTEELIGLSAKMGCKSVELIGPEFWPLLKKNGMVCAISGSHGFAKGFAHTEEHEECITRLRRSIDDTAAAGFPSVITFSGFKRKLTTEDATKNMINGLKKIVGYAEKKKVTLCLEHLNSRVDESMKGHPDYFCDDMDHTIDIIKAVGSERLKVLFDIYHVQIMNGDVIARIRQYHPYIGHYHTAGVPGRAELDDQQELNYAPIMREIAKTGYKGYVGQEFIPVRDKVRSLSEAVELCDV